MLVPETTFCSEISGPIPIKLQEHWDWLGFDNVRLYIGLIQERRDLIGGSWLVGLHYRLGGPESAQCALGSKAAPVDRVPSSRPGDPIWNIGDWL
jgi:hypothetical protein